MKTYEISKKTEIYIEQFGDVSELRVMKESEKALFMAYSVLEFGRETNKAIGFWLPKSVWKKESNFYHSKSKNFKCFNIPFFIKSFRL
tara:strand:+ start:601 stop:864 length:264 start_codon:yes stop_codon:yes gene_type:complete